MKYIITYDSTTDKFVMDGHSCDLVGDHLEFIAAQEYIYDNFISESHLLHILHCNGVEVELLEEDGSRMIW